MTNNTLDQTNLRQVLEGVKAGEIYFLWSSSCKDETSTLNYVFKSLKERPEGSIELEPDFTLFNKLFN